VHRAIEEDRLNAVIQKFQGVFYTTSHSPHFDDGSADEKIKGSTLLGDALEKVAVAPNQQADGPWSKATNVDRP
jgi:hypothetical protein